MTSYESESLSILRQILAALQGGARPSIPQPPESVAIADDRDLDSQWGDEEVRVTPRDWTGEPMKGRRMSECPPAFLDLLADTLDYFARKNAAANAVTSSGKPKADFDLKAAARARGWARRLRNGWQAASFDASSMPMADGFALEGADDDIPF